MRKLSLDLDALTVESFLPTPEERASNGTIRGHDYTWDDGSCDTCVCETNEYTCGTGTRPTLNYTCNDYTCPGMGDTCYPAKTCAPPE